MLKAEFESEAVEILKGLGVTPHAPSMLTDRTAILSRTPTVKGNSICYGRVQKLYFAITISWQMDNLANNCGPVRSNDACTSAFPVLVAPVGLLMQVDLHALHAGCGARRDRDGADQLLRRGQHAAWRPCANLMVSRRHMMGLTADLRLLLTRPGEIEAERSGL